MFTNQLRLLVFGLLFFLAGCQEDLMPSNDPLNSEQTTREGEVIDDISFTLSDGTMENISNMLATHDAVVFYFTMWCPVCDGHMSHIRNQIKPENPNVEFIFVDYVSGSVTNTLASQQSSGYTDFNVISDFDNSLENYFNGTMASTIIIDKNFIVRFNGLFKTGHEITNTLINL